MIPGWERLRGNGNGNPRLKNPMDREAWWATVHAVTRVGHDLATKPPPSPFIAALFITVATWKQPECPLADRQMKKMWHLHTYRSIHTQEILLGHRRGEPRTTRPLPERVTLSGTSQRGTAWSHFPVSLLTQAPPSRGPPAQNQTPSGHLPASTTRGQCWLLAPLSLPLALTGSLGACPQGSHTASPWSSASPQGFWGEPRHSLPGEQSH